MRENAPPRQLAFDLPLDPRYGREDFLVGPANEAAYALIEAWPDWPDSVLVLTGPSGSGKSHLAAIWAERAHAWTIPAAEVGADAVQHLVSNGALVIEDIDRAESRDEAALFHLLNRARERSCPVLLTSATGIDALGLATPDLRSRLRLAPRIDRSLGRARDVVAELDRDALGRGRRISRPLALAVLRRMGLDGEADPSG
jgi:chromosomal replication initiation ATPase DnaA